jgi:L,D-peptidoglycan transpeptidase YkuD (ErfK/YbiS/YcfS/YnhG family)
VRAVICFFLLGALPVAAGGPVFSLPAECSQVILGVADGWNASEVRYQCWEKKDGVWRKAGAAWPGRLGKNGLAWGLGLHPKGLEGLQKTEGDARAPAGVFELGAAYGYAPTVQRREGQEYTRVTPQDLWVEDVESPYYNQHLKIAKKRPLTEWEQKQQMRQGDPAHALKLFIAHNSPPAAQPGKGSAIFFHIWRENGGKPSHGCSVMPEDRLRELIAWVDPKRKPLYILLPRVEYGRHAVAWRLPRE